MPDCSYLDVGLETHDAKLKTSTATREKQLAKHGRQARPGARRALEWSIKTGRLFAVIALGLALWLLYDALTSPEYVVRTVVAEGNTALTAEDIAAIANVEGESVWLVRADEIETRVRQSPYVEAVHARVELPDRVVVAVRERRPEVRWMHNGVSYAVTWDGLILAAQPSAVTQPSPPAEEAPADQPENAGETNEPVPALVIPGGEGQPEGDAPPAEPPAESPLEDGASQQAPAESPPPEDAPGADGVSQLTIVDTTPNRELKPGDKVDPDALEVARRVTLRAHELPAPIQRIEWDAGLGVSLIVADGKQAVIGRSERLDEKLAILAQLLWDSTPFSYLDLRPTTPYYR